MVNRGSRPNRTGRTKLAIADRRRLAFEYRVGGLTLTAIAQEMGIAVGSVHRLIKQELQRIEKVTEADAKRLRTITLQRYDTAIAAIWHKVVAGDLDAIDRLVRVERARHQLLGTELDPKFVFETNIDFGGQTSMVEAARRKLAELFAQHQQPSNDDPRVIEAHFEETDE